MSCTSQQNSVTEKANQTLINMVRSMIINWFLLKSLWMHALKTTTSLLNIVSNKAVQKTHFELEMRRKQV